VHLTDEIAREHVSHRRGYIAMVLWSLLGFLHVSLITQWLTLTERDRAFTKYIGYVMQIAAQDQRSANEVRDLLLLKAEDLSVPVQGGEINITGKGQMLRAAVRYKADITMPIVNQGVYRLSFRHYVTPKTLP
jgi:hypothetical protein